MFQFQRNQLVQIFLFYLKKHLLLKTLQLFKYRWHASPYSIIDFFSYVGFVLYMMSSFLLQCFSFEGNISSRSFCSIWNSICCSNHCKYLNIDDTRHQTWLKMEECSKARFVCFVVLLYICGCLIGRMRRIQFTFRYFLTSFPSFISSGLCRYWYVHMFLRRLTMVYDSLDMLQCSFVNYEVSQFFISIV